MKGDGEDFLWSDWPACLTGGRCAGAWVRVVGVGCGELTMMRKPESRLREEVLQLLQRDDRRGAGEARPLHGRGRAAAAAKEGGERMTRKSGSSAVMAIGRVQHPSRSRESDPTRCMQRGEQ